MYYTFGYPVIIILAYILNARIFKKAQKYIKLSFYFRNKERIKKNAKMILNVFVLLIIIYIIISINFTFEVHYNSNLIYNFFSQFILFFIILLIGLFSYRIIVYTFDEVSRSWIISLILFIFSNVASIIIIYISLINKYYIAMFIAFSILWFAVGIDWIFSGLNTLVKEDSINA